MYDLGLKSLNREIVRGIGVSGFGHGFLNVMDWCGECRRTVVTASTSSRRVGLESPSELVALSEEANRCIFSDSFRARAPMDADCQDRGTKESIYGASGSEIQSYRVIPMNMASPAGLATPGW